MPARGGRNDRTAIGAYACASVVDRLRGLAPATVQLLRKIRTEETRGGGLAGSSIRKKGAQRRAESWERVIE